MKNIVLKRRITKEIASSLMSLQKGEILLIEGLPNVGKTSLIRHICDECALPCRYIDLRNDGRENDLLSVKKIEDSIYKLSSNGKNPDGIVVFDHIRQGDGIVKRLQKENDERFSYVLISDHEKALEDKEKVAKTFQIKPLDFSEFLLNLGIDLDDLPSFHGKRGEKQARIELNDYLLDYFLVGGFPAIVSAYLNGVNEKQIRKKLSSIDASLRLALTDTFLASDNSLLKSSLEIHSCLGSYYQKGLPQFKYSLLRKNSRGSSYRPAIELLSRYGFLRLMPRYEKSLEPSKDDYKLLPPDIGLFSLHLEENDIKKLRKRGLDEAPSAYLEALLGDAFAKSDIPFGYMWDFHSHEKIDLLSIDSDGINLYKTSSDRKSLSVYQKMAENRGVTAVYNLGSKELPSPFQKSSIFDAITCIKRKGTDEETISLNIDPDELL